MTTPTVASTYIPETAEKVTGPGSLVNGEPAERAKAEARGR